MTVARRNQIQNAYLNDSEYPFESIFQDSINQLKFEIAERKSAMQNLKQSPSLKGTLSKATLNQRSGDLES